MAKDISKSSKFNEYVNVILLIMFMAVLIVLSFQDSIPLRQSNYQSLEEQQKEILQEQAISRSDSVVVDY